MPTFVLSWDVKPVTPGGADSSRWWWGVSGTCAALPGLDVARSGIAATVGEA